MSTSCSPGDEHHRRRPHHAPATAPALDLLDEYWFFSNTLANSSKPPPLPRSAKDRERGDKGSSTAGPSRFHASGVRRLLRTPSLPSPRVGKMEMPKDDDDLVVEQGEEAAGSGSGNPQHQQQPQQVEVEVDDDDLNWSSIYEGVLRTRMAEGGVSSRSALRRAPSMPVPSSATDDDHQTKPTPRTPSRGGREARRREVRSFSASQQQPVLARSKSVFQDKKWRSWSELESIEVQGLRDLGFGVLPGLKQASGKNSRSRSSNRPYLSEAWQHVQRPPALVRVQSETRSAAEMKDQLRMWAQAVACNVRQEC